MPLGKFILLTIAGSGVWVIILALLGYLFGANHDLLQAYYNEISWAMAALGVAALLVMLARRRRKKL
jgi:membrane protein DedA with SNARE-associated domain